MNIQVQILATGVRIDEYPERGSSGIFDLRLSHEAGDQLAARRDKTEIFIRTTAFVEFDAGDGPERWDGAPQGPFAVDALQPATSAILGHVEASEALDAELGIHGLRVSRMDFAAAPRRIEIDAAVSRRLILD